METSMVFQYQPTPATLKHPPQITAYKNIIQSLMPCADVTQKARRPEDAPMRQLLNQAQLIPKYYVYRGIFGNEGFSSAPVQFYDCVAISMADDLKPYYDVPASCANSGRFLYSGSFATCIGAFAQLQSGEFALYHSYDPYRHTSGFKDFVRRIENQVVAIYVVQKPHQLQNTINALTN